MKSHNRDIRLARLILTVTISSLIILIITASVSESRANEVPISELHTFSSEVNSMIVEENHIYVITTNGLVMQLSKEGEIIWKHQVDAIDGAEHIAVKLDTSLLLTTGSGTIIEITDTGNILWKSDVSDGTITNVAMTAKYFIISTIHPSKVISISKETRAVSWERYLGFYSHITDIKSDRKYGLLTYKHLNSNGLMEVDLDKRGYPINHTISMTDAYVPIEFGKYYSINSTYNRVKLIENFTHVSWLSSADINSIAYTFLHNRNLVIVDKYGPIHYLSYSEGAYLSSNSELDSVDIVEADLSQILLFSFPNQISIYCLHDRTLDNMIITRDITVEDVNISDNNIYLLSYIAEDSYRLYQLDYEFDCRSSPVTRE